MKKFLIFVVVGKSTVRLHLMFFLVDHVLRNAGIMLMECPDYIYNKVLAPNGSLIISFIGYIISHIIRYILLSLWLLHASLVTQFLK
jgi:uncharacterized membrane protein